MHRLTGVYRLRSPKNSDIFNSIKVKSIAKYLSKAYENSNLNMPKKHFQN